MDKDAKVIQIITPKRYVLNGLRFGPEKAKRGFVFVHGLASNAFSNIDLVVPLADKNTTVITFNNRGHGKISKIKKIDGRRKKEYFSIDGGEVHEVFTECVDDIQGVVNFLKKSGTSEIYLIGHSTGCQKSVYFLSRKGKQQQIKGVILTAPISDYAWAIKSDRNGQLKKAVEFALNLVKSGKPHEILPSGLSQDLYDAQRFISLYTPDSEEEIFSYSQPDKNPKTLKSIKIPTQVFFAENDEYADRSANKLTKWFSSNIKSKSEINIINNAPHNFTGLEYKVVSKIRAWVSNLN